MAKKKHDYYGKSSAYVESFRTLATNIEYSQIDQDIKSIVVTSANPNEGKSLVSSNLAQTFANNGQKTLIIDCDLRNPFVGKVLGIENNIGLTNVILKKVSWDQAIINDPDTGLDILLTGPIPPNPSQILGSQQMKDLVKDLEEKYDYLILDSPPIGMLSDASILATIASGLIIVAEHKVTKMNDLASSIENIKHVGGNILGIVLNKVDSRQRGYGYYGYYGYY